MAAVTTAQWQQAFITKGVPRVATGAQAAQSTFATTLGKIIEAEKSIVPSLPPRGNLQAKHRPLGRFRHCHEPAAGSLLIWGWPLTPLPWTSPTPGPPSRRPPWSPSNNDSLTVRNYPQASQAFMVDVIRRHNTSGAVRVLRPLLHDNVTGMTWYTSETPSLLEIPPFVGQRIEPGDTLTVQVTGDTTHHCSVYLVNYYSQLSGASRQPVPAVRHSGQHQEPEAGHGGGHGSAARSGCGPTR